MTRAERENALHCLKVMIDEEVCEECNLYGTTGTDHCEKDCVIVAIKALEQEPVIDKIRAEIDEVYEELDGCDPDSLGTFACKIDDILDKYKAESEDKE